MPYAIVGAPKQSSSPSTHVFEAAEKAALAIA